MYLEELIKNAKNGDEKSFELLVKNYEDFYIENVKKFFGDKAAVEAKERLPILIKQYISADYKIDLYNFLYNESKTFYRKKEQ